MTTLHAELQRQHIADPDAQTLVNAFPHEDPDQFIDGLERTAHVLGITRKANYVLPQAQPWTRIWTYLVQDYDLDRAYSDGLSVYEEPIRDAIKRVVSQRITAHLAIKNQARVKAKRAKSTDIIRWLQTQGYSFRFNECEGIENNGVLLQDADYARIQCQMNDIGEPRVNLIEATIKMIADDNRYHPIREYLNSLKFDGGDPITDLANHFQSEYGVFPLFLHKWLIGACAKAMTGFQNRMLVLDGPQGIGKSNFAKWLCSPLPRYFRQAEIDPHDDDDKRRLSEFWIWEVQELGSSMRKSDWEAIKGYLRQETVSFRRKYGKTETKTRALTSFIGTINNEEGFLPNADRMFFIERILSIDWTYTKIDVNQVWAQAMMLYLSGEKWEPETKQEREQIERINEEYRIIDPVEETIKKFFKIDPKEMNWWLSSTEIMGTLKDPIKGNLKPGSEIDMRKLARALTKLGLDKPKLKRTGGSPARGYFGIDYLP